LHYGDPWPLIYIGQNLVPRKSGGYIRMVELADQSFSGTSCMTPNLLSLPDLARWGQEATRKAVTD